MAAPPEEENVTVDIALPDADPETVETPDRPETAETTWYDARAMIGHLLYDMSDAVGKLITADDGMEDAWQPLHEALGAIRRANAALERRSALERRDLDRVRVRLHAHTIATCERAGFVRPPF